MDQVSKIAIVGGGIVGLVTALELLQLPDVEITIFDPSPGKGATYAAAGMIAPTAEMRPNETDSYALQLRAIPAWQEVLGTLQLPLITLQQVGTLYVGWDASDKRQLGQLGNVVRKQGGESSHVDKASHVDLFRGLHPNVSDGLFMPGDAWLEPDFVVPHLLEELRGRGVRLLEMEVLECTPNGVVRTGQGAEEFAAVVLATGAAVLSDRFPATHNTVRPIRGITVFLESTEIWSGPMIRAFIRGRDFYVVNRGNGTFVIGASSEEKSTLGVEAGELERLLRDAIELLPFLETASITTFRRGLRPASMTNDPFLERIDGSKVAYSSGHFRHGVTLAPVTARETSHLVQGILSEN
jgi:glycine oxidase